ncbi:MAG: hypothetical protein HQK72_05075 [Desulfamplus sp.]|nr:hypothetical protein [Desulfamplus sp.]
MNKHWIMIIAVCIMVVGSVSFAIADDPGGPTVEGKVITTTTVHGNVDVKNEGQLDAGGITITGDGTTIDSNSEVNSTVDLKDITVDGKKVGIGNVNINESGVENSKIILDHDIDHVNSKNSEVNLGNVDVDNSNIKEDALLKSTVKSTGTITATDGKIEMGNIKVKNKSEVSGGAAVISNVENTKNIEATNGTVNMGNIELDNSKIQGEGGIISDVANYGTVNAKGNDSKIEMGNISLKDSKVLDGAVIGSTVVNSKEVTATNSGTVSMGTMNIQNSTISGKNTQVGSHVFNDGIVKADGPNSTIEMGGVDVIDGTVKDSKIDTTVINNGNIEATGGGKIGMGKIGVYGGNIENGTLISDVTNDGTVKATGGGQIEMGKIGVYGGTVKGGTLQSTVKVNSGGRVTADGKGSKANLGGIRVGGQKN